MIASAIPATADAENASAIGDPTAASATAYYIYAIARRKTAGRAVPLDIAGIDPQSDVYTLAYRDLLAIVSAVPLAEFQPDVLKERLSDQEWLCTRALAHQSVLAALLGDYTAVPLKFCTLYTSEGRILEMLKADTDALSSALDRLAGAAEWGVKMFCDREQLIDWATNSSDELQPLRATMSRMSAGASYMLRKKIALSAQQLAESIEHTYAQAGHLRLGRVARAAVSHPAQASEVHGQSGTMVLNGAYLVDDRDQLRFEAELAQLQAEYAALGFRCELIGPWPSYSFAIVEEGA
jgi:hypothetical protein